MTTKIINLPKDTLVEIMLSLPVRSTLSYCRTNKSIESICKYKYFWQKKYEKMFGKKPNNKMTIKQLKEKLLLNFVIVYIPLDPNDPEFSDLDNLELYAIFNSKENAKKYINNMNSDVRMNELIYDQLHPKDAIRGEQVVKYIEELYRYKLKKSVANRLIAQINTIFEKDEEYIHPKFNELLINIIS